MAKTSGFAQGLYKQSATQMEELGTIWELPDGRAFAYSKAGGTDLAVAKLTQNAVLTANAHNEAVPAAAAIGATTVSITFGGAVVANAYKDGWLHVNDATGEGYMYRIKGHPAGTSSVQVDLYDPIRVALVASTSEVTLTANIQNGVIVCPTTLTGIVTGVPPIAVTASNYFWNQVRGPAVVLTDGTIVIGEWVAPSNAVAGAVEALVAATTPDCSVGIVMQVNADTEYSLIHLAIPGY